MKGHVILFLCLVCLSVCQQPPLFNHGVDLSTNRPLIIAHQGSAGRYPEHTVPGYQRAVDEGADVIECDLCLSRDLHVICSHESWLNVSSNVAEVFPSRVNSYFIIDKLENITDYFTVDFTLEELKQIRRRQRQPYRDPSFDDLYPIATLEECIQVVKSANRTVGLHLETKERQWVNGLDILQSANTTLEDLVLDVLKNHNYTRRTDPCFLQSFSRSSIDYFATRTELPLVMLINDFMSTDNESLLEYSQFVYGIGPTKSKIVITNGNNQIIQRTDLIARAHAFGLKVHPFTMRNENQHLTWDYAQDPNNEYMDYLLMEADGLFTDFPETYYRFLASQYECN